MSSPLADVRWFVDPETGRVLRATWFLPRSVVEVTKDYANWRTVADMSLPFSQKITIGGKVTSVEIKEIEINPDFAADVFSRPSFPEIQRPELLSLGKARRIRISDVWGGLGTPRSAIYTLRRTADGFDGEAQFVVGENSLDESIAVPLDAALAFLSKLSAVPLEQRDYRPRIEHTDDYPQASDSYRTSHVLSDVPFGVAR